MRKVMAFGTFDLIHPGHYYYLNRARALGNYLIVVVARDTNVVKAKGRAPANDEETRLRHVVKMAIADEAILGDASDPLRLVEKHRPDVIALGYDQKPDSDVLKEELARRGLHPEIMRIGPFMKENYKSSKLREKLNL